MINGATVAARARSAIVKLSPTKYFFLFKPLFNPCKAFSASAITASISTYRPLVNS